MQEYQLRREHLMTMVNTPDLQLRQGADLLFRLAQEMDVPFHIFSAGLYDVIHAFLEHHDLNKFGMHVVSNMMVFGEDGVLQGFEGTLIHTMNKNSMALHASPAWQLVKVGVPCTWAQRLKDLHGVGPLAVHCPLANAPCFRIDRTCCCWATTRGMWAWPKAWRPRSRSTSAFSTIGGLCDVAVDH